MQQVKTALQARFPKTAIVVRSPAIVIPFGVDGGEQHEIIPCYLGTPKHGFAVYKIPDRGTGYMDASPLAHNAYVNKVNDKLSKKVKQLIRLIKFWNYVQDVGLRSFYLELRTAEYANGEMSILYDQDVKRMFSTLVSKALAAMQDPQGISGYVYPCSDAKKPDALSKLNTALIRAEKALEAQKAGKTAEAFGWWDKVFSGKFPGFY